MIKVYVDKNNKAAVICPKCKLERNADVTKFKNTHKRLKAKCRCGEIFRITLEFRNHHRKEVRLPGEYFVQRGDEKGEIIVENISAGGILFISLDPHYISRNDTVELKFTLDDPMKTEIHTHVEVRWIVDQSVGGKFLDPKSLGKDLEIYLQT